jgi:hypothetical protein
VGHRQSGVLISSLLVLAAWVLAPPAAHANAPIVVKSAANSGAKTLREAITTANSRPGADRIEFDLPGPAPHVIMFASSLPTISETLTIDGTTQPGFSPATHVPVVVLDGSVAPSISSAMVVTGEPVRGSQIRGLEIVNWSGNALRVIGAPDVVIAGNYIGTDGTNDLGNGDDIPTVNGAIQVAGESRNLRIGGTTPADRNVISGNASNGIYIDRSAGGAFVLGNYLGTNAAGTAAVAPGSGAGVDVDTSADVVVGGTAPGAGNLISGMAYGVRIFFTSATVVGNRIGTNAAGTAAIPNGYGVQLQVGHDSVIGGTTARARNLISGTATGISIERSDRVVVQGNWIGTNAAGTAAIPNTDGVAVGDCCGSSNENRIGGTAAGAANVISGNTTGIRIFSGDRNKVLGNLIGTRPDGKTALGNAGAGIRVERSGGGSASFTTIGSTAPGGANEIAFNGGSGVAIVGDGSAIRNRIRANSIHGNGGLGIDLAPGSMFGVTPNDDDDVDSGPNGLLNVPEIDTAVSGPSGITVTGTVDAAPAVLLLLEFFANDLTDESGHGEGAIYLGVAGAFADGNGETTFTQTFPLIGGRFVTATATDEAGNTSEFSPFVEVEGTGGFRFARSTTTVGEGAGHATLSVRRVGGSDGAVTVRVATANGSAKAPGDYTAVTRVLHFANGQTNATVSVPLVNDSKHEGDERFTVRLSDPRGAGLGAPTTAQLTIRASD